jgi:hypothetical protein
MSISEQTSSHILMLRPANFGFNPETAESNAFQSQDQSMNPEEIRKRAVEEFDTFVNMLRGKFIHVHVYEDTEIPVKPDAIFPNNWVTFHEDGSVITYPMEAKTRRLERREDILLDLASKFDLICRYYLEPVENENRYLEGTGSMVFDRINKIVYACRSSRTDLSVLKKFAAITGYSTVSFSAVDKRNHPVYHTNVMMAIGDEFVVVCLESVSIAEERTFLNDLFSKTGKEVIEITLDQMDSFAGNMLQVKNDEGQQFLIMSEQAYNSLRADQVDQIKQFSQIISPPLYTIEKYGGGSARCMMAEIFLPVKKSI